MSPGDRSLGGDYFEDLYARDPDPWRMQTSRYERDKYAETLAALDGGRFASAVEIGCANGELSAVLASRCDADLGIDIVEPPLQQARRRNAGSPHVRFERLTLPDEKPKGAFDLIVLSEVLYYFSRGDLDRLGAWVVSALRPQGVALLVHWLGETPDYPLSGDEAVHAFLKTVQASLTTDLHSRRELYRIDRLVHRAASG